MKKSIYIAICDDNQLFSSKLKEYLLDFFPGDRNASICVFDSGFELLEAFDKKFFDVVFLDIDMPVMDGFKTAERISESNNSTLLVFVTSFDDKVYTSWEYNPFWFVRKSHFDDLKIVLPRIFQRLDSDEEKLNGSTNLIAEKEIVRIDFNSVLYIEALNHNLKIIEMEKDVRIFRCKVSEAERQLADFGFIRIQNGILVNIKAVVKLSSRCCILQNGKSFNIGRKYLEMVRRRFSEHLRNS